MLDVANERTSLSIKDWEILIVLTTGFAVILNHAFRVVAPESEFLIPSVVSTAFGAIGLIKCIFANDTRMQWFHMSFGVLIFMTCFFIDYFR